MKVAIFEPQVIFWGIAAQFHGYAIAFINKYADVIYFPTRGFIRNIRTFISYKRQFKKIGITRKVKFVFSIKECNNCDVMVGFTIPAQVCEELKSFKGVKCFHLMDYYLAVQQNKAFLKSGDVQYVIGHTQMDKNCEFFKKYYPEYIGKCISLPFGYAPRFTIVKPFVERNNRAVGLGSINPVNDPLLNMEIKKEFVSYFSNETFMHPLRKYLQDNATLYEGVIDARFPSPDKQKDFSYDAVEMLNSYKMFINDEGLSNFPPARTYEGIACGCVMVASDSQIYKDIGFIPDVNYISFEKGNYKSLKYKLNYYTEHNELLNEIQKKSVQLSKNFSHEKMADCLMELIKAKEN